MKSKTFIFGAIVIVVIALAAYYFNSNGAQSSKETIPSGTITLKAPKGDLSVFVATSSEDQEQGLGGRDAMPSDEGMLFAFDQPGSYSFWMQDMNFPLDLVWVNEDKTVAGLTPDVATSTYPDTFVPPNDVSYVLELNAGVADKFGIATGTLLQFEVGN